jgi:hypothetical protein
MIRMLWTRAGATNCGVCHLGGFEVNASYLAKAWEQEVGRCPGCSAELSYWDRLVANVSDRSDLWHAVTMAGGFSTTFLQLVPYGQTFVLRFADYGVPENAVIYKVIGTVQAQGGMPGGVVVLAHASQAIGGQLHGESIALHPVLLGAPTGAHLSGEQVPAEIDVAFTVVWAPDQPDSVAHGLLLSAFGAFGEGDLKRCLLDADSAIDITLKQLVTSDLVPGWSRKLPNLGYEQRLLLVMSVLSARGLGVIPEFFLNLLLDLRVERNRVAHGTSAQVDSNRAAVLISGALVAMTQLNHLLRIG